MANDVPINITVDVGDVEKLIQESLPAEPARTDAATVITFLRDWLAEIEQTGGTIKAFEFRTFDTIGSRKFTVEWKVNKEGMSCP